MNSNLEVQVVVTIHDPEPFQPKSQTYTLCIGDTIEFKDDEGKVVARMDLYEPEGYQLMRREGQEEKFVEVDSNR